MFTPAHALRLLARRSDAPTLRRSDAPTLRRSDAPEHIVSLKAVKGIALFSLLLCFTDSANAQALLSSAIINPSNNNTYYLLTASSWTDAQAFALTLGGNLATINDASEQNFVFSTFGSFAGRDRSLWIGLREVDTEGNYQWVSGDAVTYTNWLSGEPNNAFGTEAFVHMIKTGNGFGATPGTWNDIANTNPSFPEFAPLHGVVEINTSAVAPEPASLALVLSSVMLGAGIVRRSRRK